VAATPDGDREVGLGRQPDRGRDVVGVDRPEDESRTPIQHPVEDRACGVVLRMIRGDDLAPRACEKRSLEGFYLTSLQMTPIQPRTVRNLSPMVNRTLARPRGASSSVLMPP
jgi:hypothetical protein